MSGIDVAVNLMWMNPGRVGGSEQYLTRQLAGLDAPDIDVTLHTDGEFEAAYPELAARFRTEPVVGIAASRAARIVAEHAILPVAARGCDVVHHGGGTIPIGGRRRAVLTIHDLQYLVFPEYFSVGRRRYLELMVPRSVRRASVVAVPSEAVRAHVIEAFGVADDDVVVVPHGVPAMATPSRADIAATRDLLGIGHGPIVVYPAITHPHKQHPVLIAMLDHLDHDDETTLVLLGGAGSVEHEVRAAIDASPHRSRIVRPGRIPATALVRLIADADALLFPSEFEGFGAPLIEAMALDTPVVCSAAAAVTEVVGDAAVVVTESTGEAWADGLSTARRRRDELVESGRRRRAEFTIGRSGRAVAEAYRRAAAS